MSGCDSLKLITDAYIASCLQQYGSQSAAVTIGNNGKKAAVLVPFFRRGEEWHILYTRAPKRLTTIKVRFHFWRSNRRGDKNPSAAAMREAYEEIGLEPKAFRS
jgi:8-oxo-dGTP pyrophosphatase MutT (NUDIX family)